MCQNKALFLRLLVRSLCTVIFSGGATIIGMMKLRFSPMQHSSVEKHRGMGQTRNRSEGGIGPEIFSKSNWKIQFNSMVVAAVREPNVVPRGLL